MKDSVRAGCAPGDPASVNRRPGPGTLYVTATPIGNLEDITVRALDVLARVDLIAAENMAHTRGLCRRYGIETRITGYRRENRKTRTPDLIRRLKSGRDVALVTDAGTPGISDPGTYLVRHAAGEGITVVPVPGPSAVTAALSVSGIPAEGFVFSGFLPAKAGKRKQALKRLASESRTLVFFEAPHRIRAMLGDLREVLGNRRMVLLRELTKVFEEVIRGRVDAVLDGLPPEKARGEFTLVVEGCGEQGPAGLDEAVLERIGEILDKGETGVRETARRISSELGVPYRRVYRECLARKRAFGDPDGMEQVRKLKIRNNLGLHARAAGKIVELAQQYRSRLFLRKNREEVDGSSILSILTLSCPKGTEIEARVVGEDSARFMEALSELFDQKFGEDG